MPFQQTSVAGIAPIGRPGLRDLASSLSQGMQLAYVPDKLEEQKKAAELSNQLSSMRNQFYPDRDVC